MSAAFRSSTQATERVTQGYLSRVFPAARCAQCGRFIVGRSGDVPVRRSVDLTSGRVSSSYGNLNQCGDTKMCMHCARVEALRDADDLRAVVQAAYLRGFRVVMATHTFSHAPTDDYGPIRTAFRDAMSDMRSGRAYAALRKKYGAILLYMGEEETFGDNGPHPHEHDLYALSRFADAAAFRRDLWALYSASLAKFDLKAAEDVGLHVDASQVGVSDYVCKRGLEAQWDAIAEASGGANKRGRKGRTFWQLVYDAATKKDARAARWVYQYVEYWSASGRRRSSWPAGVFRKLLGYNRSDPMPADTSSEEYRSWLVRQDAKALTAAMRVGDTVLTLTSEEWSAVLFHDAKYVLLWLVTVWSGTDRLRAYVSALLSRYRLLRPVCEDAA